MKQALRGMVLVAGLMLSANPVLAQGSPPLPAGCGDSSAAARAACLYTPRLAVNPANIGVIDGSLTDPQRDNYEVLFRIRYPTVLPGPRPVIIWNHGGEPRTTGRLGSANWGDALVQAGYIVIHPSRSPAATAQLTVRNRAICASNSVPSSECADWLGQSYYGATNTDFLISSFSAIESAYPALAGKLDADRIAVAGWSAGSAVTLSNAGASRQFKQPRLISPTGGPIYSWRSSRPIAFMAVAPFGPDHAGFNYHPRYSIGGFYGDGLESVDNRPFLFVTGKGDKNAVAPEARTAAFFRSNPTDKLLAWDKNSVAVHGTMDISQCNANAVQLAHCRWIRALGLAFMDAHLMGHQPAIDWLESGALGILTRNEIELYRRPQP